MPLDFGLNSLELDAYLPYFFNNINVIMPNWTYGSFSKSSSIINYY